MLELIFDKGARGRTGFSLPDDGLPEIEPSDLVPKSVYRADSPNLPEVDELTVVRHYTNLSRKSFGVDLGIYPLGSCTMKYNPKINEELAADYQWTRIHPLQPEDTVQGCLQVLWELQSDLCRIFGMDAFSLQPAAGAHGELTGLMIIKAFNRDRKEKRGKILIPDSAHGTNPASAAMCGYEVVEVSSDDRGNVDITALSKALNSDIAALMLTNPNTLGLFEENILKISEMVHDAGALLYYDGANANAILGKARPGDMGFDVMHVNLHKTFAAPHGGGGPGSGPVGVKRQLEPYLPTPRVIKDDNGKFSNSWDSGKTIGSIRSFYGNFLVNLKAYIYIKALGGPGLSEASELAVLNANYLKQKLQDSYQVPYDRTCMHEFVLSAQKQKQLGVRAVDIAKKLLDKGVHAPTIYFPLIVPEAIMLEPTETESKEGLDYLSACLKEINCLALENPNEITSAPQNTPVTRLDEATAARKPDVCFKNWT